MTDIPWRADGDGVERRTFLGVGGAVALGPIGRVLRSDAGSSSSPRETAVAYVSALDAGDRRRANELIADDGELDSWSEREFKWVPAFDVRYAGAEIGDRTDDGATASIDIVISGKKQQLRYRLREVDGEWQFWAALDGLRPEEEDVSTPRAAANTYVMALDAGDRQRANELIADDGELDSWSEREFEWVPAFDIGLARFEPVDRRDGRVVADLAVTVDGDESVVRYEFRWLGPTGWRVCKAPDGLRVRT